MEDIWRGWNTDSVSNTLYCSSGHQFIFLLYSVNRRHSVVCPCTLLYNTNMEVSLPLSLSLSLTHSLPPCVRKVARKKMQWRKKLIFCFYVSVFGCASANVSKIRCAHWAAVASAFAYIHPNVWECDPVRKLHAQRTASTCPRGHRRTASWMKHWWKWWQLWCSLSSVTLKEEWIF